MQYKVEKIIDGFWAHPRYLLIQNYDKLLHVAITFMLLAFLYPLSAKATVVVVIGLQVGKEVADYLCGDRRWQIIGDLLADAGGWLLFGLWFYFGLGG